MAKAVLAPSLFYIIFIMRTSIHAALVLVSSAALAEPVQITVVDASGAPLRDAVVSVHGVSGSSSSDAELDQKELRFVPRVLAVRQGATVHFLNSDTVNHHVYSFSKARRFDLRLNRGADGDRLAFDEAGTVTIGCNIHDWMLGYIRVVDSPFFAVTDERGQATIDVPLPRPASARVKLWHPQLQGQDESLEIELSNVVTMRATQALKPYPWPDTPDYK